MFTKAGKRRRGSSLREEGGHGLHGLTRIFLPDRLRRLANLLATKTHELTRKNTLKPLFRVFSCDLVATLFCRRQIIREIRG